MTSFHRSAQWRRRDFIRTGAQGITAAALASTVPLNGLKALESGSYIRNMTGTDALNQLADKALAEQLVLRAVDAAKSAGAQYAEARVTRTVMEEIAPYHRMHSKDYEYLAIGVRVLVKGAWGFAASTYWELDEASLLAQEAVEQAKINASIFPREVDLGTYPVAKGSWSTPIRIDPFQISLEEKVDFIRSFEGLVPRNVPNRTYNVGFSNVKVYRQERTVATSEEALFSQTCYQSGGSFYLGIIDRVKGKASASGRGIDTAGAGWELFLDANLREQIPGLIEEAEANMLITGKPVDVGMYEVVMPARIVAALVRATLGDATQLDRAVGMEANAGGTSYLGPDPEDYLGTKLGSPILNVSGNRSMHKGLATVKWDDEGVEPETFSIIENGMVVDYQTSREQAPWLSSWYKSRNMPVRSHGCAWAPTADNFPLQHTPNLEVTPGDGAKSFEEMIKNTSRGIAFIEGKVSTDFQSRTGVAGGGGLMREIVDGELGQGLIGAQILFDSTQIWKNLLELGRESTAETVMATSFKGEPPQSSLCSVQAVAGRFKEIAVVDSMRK